MITKMVLIKLVENETNTYVVWSENLGYIICL